ncbi:hypothetical protein [Synechocystis sp. LKSZ1]|uniref:hypothetical protein n=1 Tax=Synechocystis sp. LKSZ1 TaxID=3144951 RepID=UPI00336BD995
MVASHRLVPLLFLPAGIGLLHPILIDGPLDQRLLALGFLLLAVDQARMARLDLANITTVQIQLAERGLATFSPSLTTFTRLTWGTILWELLGFYSGAFHLGWGIILVLSSQVFFNALATISLTPGAPEPLQPKPLGEKWGLVVANSCGIGLILLWMADVMPWAIVLGLWAIACIYAGGKILQSINPSGLLARHPEEESISTIDATTANH